MSSTATATLRKLLKVLKERAATHGSTAPAGDQGEKVTWIAAIQQAEGGSGEGGGWKPDASALWALPDDVLFKIIWLLLRTAFKQPALA